MSLKTAFASLPATIFIRRCISRPFVARWRTRFDVAPCPSYDEVGNARVLGFSRKQLTYHLSVAVSRGVRDAVQHEIEFDVPKNGHCPNMGSFTAETWQEREWTLP